MDIQFLGSKIILSTYIKLNHNVEFLVYFPYSVSMAETVILVQNGLYSILGDKVIIP